jgi:hypothetical protein
MHAGQQQLSQAQLGNSLLQCTTVGVCSMRGRAVGNGLLAISAGEFHFHKLQPDKQLCSSAGPSSSPTSILKMHTSPHHPSAPLPGLLDKHAYDSEEGAVAMQIAI